MLALLIPGVHMGAGTAAVLVEVPDVVGETQASGTSTLEGDGFVVAVETAYSPTIAEGLIISQAPEGGSFANSGSTVTITVSLGVQPAVSEQPAGRARRRKRFVVEIDNQSFEVNNVAEATALLERAKVIASELAEKSAKVESKRARRRKRTIKPLSVPRVETTAPELQSLVSEYRADIEAIYQGMARDAELRELWRLKLLEEDEEDAITALLLH